MMRDSNTAVAVIAYYRPHPGSRQELFSTMSTDLTIVLLLLGATIAMFAWNRPRMDVVALIMMTTLPLTGVITVEETLAGFSNPTIILIAALFVLGEGLVRTGVAQKLGDMLVQRAGRSEARLIVLLMITVAGIGSVMSSTGVVAIFIPIVLRIARNAHIPAGRLMMPLSVAALISGMMTLVATPPNLIVHNQLVSAGYEGLSFFAITPFGIPILLLAIGYMLMTRRWLAAAPVDTVGPQLPRLSQWIDEYGLSGREHRLRILHHSPWIDKRLDELDLRATSGVNIIAVERRKHFSNRIIQPTADLRLQSGDVLFLDVRAAMLNLEDLSKNFALQELPFSGHYFADQSQAIGMAQLMIPDGSDLIGKTVVNARFRSRYDLAVIGLKRGNQPHSDSITEEKLKLGDTLLVVGPWRAIRKLQEAYHNLVLLKMPAEAEEVLPAPSRAPFALIVLLAVIAMMVSGVVPNVIAALIGCLLLGAFKCIDMNSAYNAIHWQSLILIVGMLPFAVALQNTGGVDLAAGLLLDTIGNTGPRTALAAIFILTAVMGMFISNTATAVLIAPVALAVASELGLSPYPFAMAVALAASAAFMTPVSSPVNTLVLGPGRYRFGDFVRVGVPFTFVVLLTTVALVPMILPF